MNKSFLIGRLVRDPETRVTLSGITVTRFYGELTEQELVMAKIK